MNFVEGLECSATGERLAAGRPLNLSPAGKPLLVRYDLEALGRRVDRDSLGRRPPGLWRYRELLPLRDVANRVSLGEGETPLVRLEKLERKYRLGGAVRVKDEGRLPTGSFKARGLALAVSMARELGLRHLAMPSNGNAGAALAAYCRRAGLASTIFCPSDTPEIHLREIESYGARLRQIDGLIDECGRIVREGRDRHGWFDCSTLREPYRVEGKKTMGLELADQMGWRLPDVILYPTGGGTGLIGMWKAFSELAELGWLEGRRPRMVAVQAAGCAPIVRAFEEGARRARRWEGARTIATGIRVPQAIGDFLILDAIRESGGFAIAVEDAAIRAAQREVAEEEGLLLCAEGAATWAAYRAALRQQRIDPEETAVLFNCATGLKDLSRTDHPPEQRSGLSRGM